MYWRSPLTSIPLIRSTRPGAATTASRSSEGDNPTADMGMVGRGIPEMAVHCFRWDKDADIREGGGDKDLWVNSPYVRLAGTRPPKAQRAEIPPRTIHLT